VHVPHAIDPPHPSGTVAQFFVPHDPVGVQPHTPEVPHVVPAAHVPHDNVPPHPSGQLPHVLPSVVQLVGVHPHTFGTPPPPHV
jgi:hypothetical protein